MECRAPTLSIDEQVAAVPARLRPVADGIRTLVATGEPEHHSRVVTATGMVLEALPGQHHLLGWHLAVADLAFLVSAAANLDVDEYG